MLMQECQCENTDKEDPNVRELVQTKLEGETPRGWGAGHRGQMEKLWDTAENGKGLGLVAMLDCEVKIAEIKDQKFGYLYCKA